ncbi:hypothetical protein TeGR_g12124 [Tetraparma gracilis]|uniref:Uncharacterized protein n=1 Tax=Tetraparma gracilis TaxID=2962635 RepID=A0ABQ6MVT9_9STRA|nr:hypothetical protein TeGR_g12124 [Tetraparma gracilis]
MPCFDRAPSAAPPSTSSQRTKPAPFCAHCKEPFPRSSLRFTSSSSSAPVFFHPPCVPVRVAKELLASDFMVSMSQVDNAYCGRGPHSLFEDISAEGEREIRRAFRKVLADAGVPIPPPPAPQRPAKKPAPAPTPKRAHKRSRAPSPFATPLPFFPDPSAALILSSSSRDGVYSPEQLPADLDLDFGVSAPAPAQQQEAVSLARVLEAQGGMLAYFERNPGAEPPEDMLATMLRAQEVAMEARATFTF